MKRGRTPWEGESGVPEVEVGLKGVGAVGEGDGDEEAVPGEFSLGQRVHEWGLNPLFWSYVKLFARDVHGLGTLDGIDDSHVLHGKAIHRVEVLGMVVHVKPGATKMFGGYVKYIIDDGTGLLPCTQYDTTASGERLHQGHRDRHDLGDLLLVRGKLKRFRGARELVIASARKPADPNEETLHWLRCVELGKTVYAPRFRRSEYVDDELVASSTQARVTRCDCGASYAEQVGYCRCVAAPLALDPDFEFRDALLSRLAEKEESLDPNEHLRFQFAKDVRDDPSLKDAAARVVSVTRSARTLTGGNGAGVAATGRLDDAASRNLHETKERPPPPTTTTLDGSTRCSVRSDAGGGVAKGPETAVSKAKVIKLLRAVMSSLHRDGALHFADKARDVYLLLSRKRVLQPGVKTACLERGLRLTQENEIIRVLQGSALFHHVPGARIRACVSRMKKSPAQPESP
ncbi:unnamed protein product [Laminaria digitata]